VCRVRNGQAPSLSANRYARAILKSGKRRGGLAGDRLGKQKYEAIKRRYSETAGAGSAWSCAYPALRASVEQNLGGPGTCRQDGELPKRSSGTPDVPGGSPTAPTTEKRSRDPSPAGVPKLARLREGRVDRSLGPRIIPAGITECLPPAPAKPQGFRDHNTSPSMSITSALCVA
jgi:hypothetical protein